MIREGNGSGAMKIRTIGLDLAKSVFQAHGVDETSRTVLVKRLHRKQMLPFFSKRPLCLIGIEACATAHHWARTLSARGHEVRLMPPSYVRGCVERGKSDALDAEAICEAVQRPSMRFVPVKTVEQQSILMAHRTRSASGAQAHDGSERAPRLSHRAGDGRQSRHRQPCKAGREGLRRSRLACP